MNLSQRSKFSLCQFLALFERDDLVLLLGKYGLSTWGTQNRNAALREAVLQASVLQLGSLVQELARTHDSMRSGVAPRYRFDERWRDLCLCLKLDGYAKEQRNDYGPFGPPAVQGIEGKELACFVPIEPVIEGADPGEDDLIRELKRSGLSESEEIIRVLGNSADNFRGNDFNGCLNNARVALQTLATSVAQARLPSHSGNFDATKWGQVVAYLRTSGFITQQQEKGLTGVFSFISPGSHIPVGFSEEEFARLGYNLAVSFCYFLVKQYNHAIGHIEEPGS